VNAFPCIKCGLCCKKIDFVSQLCHFNNGDGICINLSGNLCKIYDRRPIVCNVDEVYNAEYATIFSKMEFYKRNLEICFQLNLEMKNTLNCKKIQNIIAQLSSEN
jgi:Fe-S-cluster containining protein